MDKPLAKKHTELSLEFDMYISRHPELYDAIPNRAMVVITLNGDDEFNRQSIGIVRGTRSRRPVVEARKTGRSWVIQPLELGMA